jgi:hypothetical protein
MKIEVEEVDAVENKIAVENGKLHRKMKIPQYKGMKESKCVRFRPSSVSSGEIFWLKKIELFKRLILGCPIDSSAHQV